MNLGPYRTQAIELAPSTLDEHIEVDLFTVGVLVWVGSVARLGIAIRTHQGFGFDNDPTLAALVVVSLPWLARARLAVIARSAFRARRRGRQEFRNTP